MTTPDPTTTPVTDDTPRDPLAALRLTYDPDYDDRSFIDGWNAALDAAQEADATRPSGDCDVTGHHMHTNGKEYKGAGHLLDATPEAPHAED